MSNYILNDNEKTSAQTKHLQSEIINQKKQFIFKVEQTSDFVFPNETYKYYIYLKNISGVTIENIKIIINNPYEVDIDDEGELIQEIGSMENGEVKLIYLTAKCDAVGIFYTHFVCYGDGTGLFHKTLKLYCSYNNISNNVVHRVHIYDFNPYENTYMMEADDFNDQTTQLFKTQKLPFMAGEQPFPMISHKGVERLRPFSNVESDSFYHEFNDNDQYSRAKNTKEHGYQYITRENFNENSKESFEGENLTKLIQNINENSNLFKATQLTVGTKLRTGTNELFNDLIPYQPNGFMFRFGLLNSELYHYLGVIPTYSYMSDYLFRWAPDGKEPLNLIPQKKAFKWNEHKWAGRGWVVYQIATKEYMETQHWKNKFDEDEFKRSWSDPEYFDDLNSAETYIDMCKEVDETIRSQLGFEFIMYNYIIRESYYDSGVFFINIPLNKIPSNFNILKNEDIVAIVQRTKPMGLKPLIRYSIEKTFTNNMEFLHHLNLKPYFEFDFGDMDEISYFIESLRYKKVTEQICGQNISSIKLMPHKKAVLYGLPFENNIEFLKSDISHRIIYSDLKTTDKYLHDEFPCPYQSGTQCNFYNNCFFKENNLCKYGIKHLSDLREETDKPDNNIDMDMECEVTVDKTIIDNQFNKLSDLIDILYQNNNNNLGFKIPSAIYKKINLSQENAENNFITNWAKNHNYTSLNFKIEEVKNHKDEIGFSIKNNTSTNNFYNFFKIYITNENTFNLGNTEIGIGLLDSQDRYHYLSAKHDNYNNLDNIKYSTSFNNNYYNKKSGYANITSLVYTIIPVGFKKIVVFFVEENSEILHYFHHIIVSDISDIFIFMSNELLENQTGQEIDWTTAFSCDYISDTQFEFETNFVNKNKHFTSPILDGGENWTNLYRIDVAENSYTHIQNKTNDVIVPDDIILHFDNLNILNNCIIKDIRLNSIIGTSTPLSVFCECATQGNNNFEDAITNSISLKPNYIECYKLSRDSQYHYQQDMDDALKKENTTRFELDERLLQENILFNQSLNFDTSEYINNYDKYITISKDYWIEISDFIYKTTNCNNVNTIKFVLEGYNTDEECNIICQLLSLQEEASRISVKIPSGYFYKEINIPFMYSFIIDELRVKFRFEGLNHDIKLFNSYININFKNKDAQELEFIDTDDIVIKNKQNINLNCLDTSFLPEDLNNGLTAKLSFDSLSPGEFYRIYSISLQIIYQETDMEILINKNKFNYVTYDNAYTTISGNANDAYLSGKFYNDVATVSQIESTIDADNHGLELKEALYQSFTAQSENITSIEIYPNGFKGSPDDTLKIGLYTNHGNTPNKLIKEVYANGWTKSNDELKNLYSIKYNFNINNLTIGEQYWIKIEVDNPNENSYYLLRYTTEKQPNFKLLLEENNDYINTFGSLEFNIYSENLSQSFARLPTVQDYFNNPYILIGLHKNVGTLSNIKIKKK